MDLSRKGIEDWLLKYAWANDGDEDANKREVACIMSQDGWEYVGARADQFMGQASGEETDIVNEATGFALSALYECHDGPHLDTCPRKH